MIRVEGIRKVFNKRTRNANEVLKGVSFELPDKGLVAIFGKSGSGKTTLLNIMGGLDRQDKGRIFIDGEDTKGKVDRIRNAKIGFIFQNYYLEGGYTVEEILHNAMVIAGFSDEAEIRRRTDEVLKLVKLDRFRSKTADALSGGQKQRVAIARALIKGSDVILADEPTGNLDSENTESIMEILKEISRTQLVVLVTHEVNLIYRYADSHIKLVDGELLEDGELDSQIEVEAEKNNLYVDPSTERNIPAEGASVRLYGDPVEAGDIQIFSKDGSVYLKASKDVQILNANSEKQVIFEGQEKKQEQSSKPAVPKFEKSTARRNGRLFRFSNVWKSFRNGGEEKAYSTGNIFKQIFIAVMAAILCFFSFFTTEALNVKIQEKPTKPGAAYIDMDLYSEIRLLHEEHYSSIDFFELNYQNGIFAYNNQQSMAAIHTDYAPRSLDSSESGGVKLETGEMPENGEILITRALAEQLKKQLRKEEYQTDGAILLLMFEKQYPISGIVEGSEPYVYMNRANYVNFLGVYREIRFTDTQLKFFDKEFINADNGETVNGYRAEIRLYEGETLDLEDDQCTVEINRSSTYLMMNDTKDADFKIDTVNRLLLKTPQYIGIVNSNPVFVREFTLNRDDMDTDIRIYVNENTLERIFAYIAPNLDALDNNSRYFFEVNTDSPEQYWSLHDRLVHQRGIAEDRFLPERIAGMYQSQNRELVEKAVSDLAVFALISVLLFIIYYFIEKSGSIKNSKEYGIYRAIGINRSNLLCKEVILTVKESLIGFVISYGIVTALIAARYWLMNLPVWNYLILALAFALASQLLMIFISLIPYFFVLYKTPSEILSKYDI